ncbi:MAG: hypothetical protein ACPGWR_11800 [Ardenticatenaceae bacterium]
MTAYYSETGTDLASLAAGEPGIGMILYYLPERGIERPSLVVRLSNDAEKDYVEAEIFDAPADQDYVPGWFSADEFTLSSSLVPKITMQGLDGWWVQNQVVSYNLNIQINGAVVAMWGAGYNPERGPQGWPELVEPGELAVSITVRDPEQSGIPKWDLRLLEPPFANHGFIRANYAERKCDTPTEVDRGVSPLWPYVAVEGRYEQKRGQLNPPIVVDWNKAQIIYMSEMVTVRNQNCSYSLYSISALGLEEQNQPNFETPFAFYDLSGEGTGYPNLLLRTERYPVGDPFVEELEEDFQTIRYSWRNQVGDWQWDYKIEVLGFYPYEYETPIAEGLLSIDAPPYEKFPEWVVEKEWPVVTFIDTEGTPYRTSEGIYEWSPREVGINYLFGWQDSSAGAAFSKNKLGLRGEYRFKKNLPPQLYLSPIDNRLHLRAAEGGLWHMTEEFVLRLHNIDGGPHINGWTRERIPEGADYSQDSKHGYDVGDDAPEVGEVEEALYSLDGHLLYSSLDEVVLHQSSYSPSILNILPPKDRSTWLSFQEQVEATTSQRRDPMDLKSWLSDFPSIGDRAEPIVITKARFFNMRKTEEGFRFVLHLLPGFEIQQAKGSVWSNLSAGEHIVTYDGQWTVESALLPKLSITIQLPEEQEKLSILEEIPIQLLVENSGFADVKEVQLVGQASNGQKPVEITKEQIDLLSGDLTSLPLNWQPKSAGEWILRFRLEDQEEKILVEMSQPVTISDSSETRRGTVFSLSTGGAQQSLVVFLLVAFAVSMMSALFVAQRKT